MAMNPLPPQAYTKETMLTAYAWLQNQSPNIREMATTPDILVSLYLKATRDGDSSLDRPSIQNFKNELKNLAGLMGELENPPTPHHTSAQAHAQVIAQSLGLAGNISLDNSLLATGSAHPAHPASSHKKTAPSGSTGPSAFSLDLRPGTASQAGTTSTTATHTSTIASAGTMISTNVELDAQSREMIREVKAQLNLSSESEALRAIVRLGHLQITRLFR